MDPYAAIGFRRNHDGSLTRTLQIPRAPPSSDLNDTTQLLSKDVTLNSSTNTSVRLFLPPNAAARPKLPIIIYASGGGFVIPTSATSLCHLFCSTLAHNTPAFVVSVEYRMAPEHRLPAAYDDYMEALHWVKSTDDEWLTNYADLSNCYLMGTSAGGNIALDAGLRAADCTDELEPIEINGLILHQPFFGGIERTPSETVNSAGSKTLSLPVSDIMWELSLPVGADRDHEYSNPMMHETVRRNLDKIKDKGWKVALTGCGGDTLVDRQKEVVEALAEKGVAVVAKFVDGEYHGYDVMEPAKAELIMAVVKETVQLST
ncbi:hypothetical protein C2S52_012629 [Perilla frutescens var. hirtella]|nr:hypothetical protein C2S52_012629 [Perilla frutescens var. hirtella]